MPCVTIGKFPNKKLKEARNQYLLMLDEGKDPAEVKRLKKNTEGMSFKEVAQSGLILNPSQTVLGWWNCTN